MEKDKKFSIWVDLEFQPNEAERKRVFQVLAAAWDELKIYLEDVTGAHRDERGGKHEISAHI